MLRMRYTLTALMAVTTASLADVPIFLPGAPGEAGKTITAAEAIEIAESSHSPDDVIFMQDMIPHHNQAVQMASLVEARTNNEDVKEIAGKINAAQADEIEFMQGWLVDREEEAPDPLAHHHMHTHHDMAGMASPEDMARLADSEGVDFDRLFLKLMIAHHEGALEMVDHLLKQPGAAYDPILFEFVNDVKKDQKAEIKQMNGLLVELSDDPRANLKAGFDDAGEAILNLELVASLPKPAGFFDPANPSGLPLEKPKKDDKENETGGEKPASEPEDANQKHHEITAAAADKAVTDGVADGKQTADEEPAKDGDPDDDKEDYDKKWSKRSAFFDFSNTDMAFAGDVLVAGSYHGFNTYRLDPNGVPELLGSVVCPGGQGDVSIVGDLLIMSVEQTRGRVDCGLQGINEDISSDRFRGLRIFDISDLAAPRQVGQVQTCRGSHTHSVVAGPDSDGKIIVYNSGTSYVRKNEELDSCFANRADDRTALFRIDVVEIPIDDPSQSRIIDSPAVFSAPESGLAGLWQGGDHGEDTQDTFETNQCHDITVFPEAGIAAGACAGNGIVFDISNPRKPERIDAVVDTGFAYWHSATFNNTGNKVLFTDEWGGGMRPRCRSFDPLDWGANAIYDIVDGKLEFRSYFKIPAPQLEEENCVAHNGAIIPVPGRDLFVQAWYQGGISVIDFTDSDNIFEIAYFDRGPIHEEHLVFGGYWSAYWYNGRIYGTEIARGLDVFQLLPSDYLTLNEIEAAMLADQGNVFNPQQQFRVTWPASPVIARAYIDQLDRDNALEPDDRAAMLGLLEQTEATLQAQRSDRKLSGELRDRALSLTANGELTSADRMDALAGVLMDLADKLDPSANRTAETLATGTAAARS